MSGPFGHVASRPHPSASILRPDAEQSSSPKTHRRVPVGIRFAESRAGYDFSEGHQAVDERIWRGKNTASRPTSGASDWNGRRRFGKMTLPHEDMVIHGTVCGWQKRSRRSGGHRVNRTDGSA